MSYVEKRGKNSFRLVATLGFNAKGERIRETKTVKCKNKTEAEKELAKFVVEIETGQYIAPQKMSFSVFVSEWIEKYARKHLAPKTFENYMYYLNQRLLPTFGHLRMDAINTFQILNFLESLNKNDIRCDGKEGGLSSATIQYYHRILKNIFSRAFEWKVIKENPVANIKKPRVESKKGNVFTEAQVQELMEHLSKEDIKWKTIIMLAITTGMRRGELLGLEWRHVDLEKGKIYVQQALSYTKENGYIFKTPKTKNSIRTISLSDSVVQQLQKYKRYKLKERLRMGIESETRFLLFSSEDGAPMYPSSVTSWWKERLEMYELPHITFHQLRHTSATLLINRGTHMKIVSARLGHSKIGTTMDLYSHALESADETAANQFDQLLTKNQKEQV